MIHPSMIISLKRLFIIAWKVAGELQSPKNITVDSKRPQLILKAAFHWSPSLTQTLLYPDLRSILVKIFAPRSLSVSSVIRRRG